MKTKRAWALAVAVTGLLALAAAPALAQDECAACHEDVVKGFSKSSHGRYFAAEKEYQGSSCTSCHTATKEHVESGGEKKPPSLRRGAAPEANAPCLSCHAGHKKQALWEGSAHQMAGLRCASCHDVHAMHIGTPEQQKALPGATPTTRRPGATPMTTSSERSPLGNRRCRTTAAPTVAPWSIPTTDSAVSAARSSRRRRRGETDEDRATRTDEGDHGDGDPAGGVRAPRASRCARR